MLNEDLTAWRRVTFSRFEYILFVVLFSFKVNFWSGRDSQCPVRIDMLIVISAKPVFILRLFTGLGTSHFETLLDSHDFGETIFMY
jgi:hypothetical protein